MLEQLSIKDILMKRLLILAAMVAAMMLAIAPTASAFAQSSEPSAEIVGVVEAVSPTPEGPTHTITEASTGDVYGLFSDAQGVDLSQYEGLSVVINGIFQTQGSPLSSFDNPTNVPIYVTSVELLDVGPGGAEGEEITVAGLLEARGLAADRADITHYITDEGTGRMWGLISDDPQNVLDPYNGQRVTVTGADATDFTPGGEEIPAIAVTGVDPSGTRDGNPPNDAEGVEGKPENLSNETFQGYAADVGSAGMRIDSDQSGEPCAGGASLTATFTAETGFFTRHDGVDVPITVDEVSDGDPVLVAYTLAPDEAIAAVCPSPQINVDFVTVLEDSLSGDNPKVNSPKGDSPNGSTPDGSTPNGNTPDQYGSTSGSTSDQYTNGGSVDSPSASPDSSGGTGSSAGLLGLLPDTGGLSLLTLGFGSLLLMGGGLLGYRFIRQR